MNTKANDLSPGADRCHCDGGSRVCPEAACASRLPTERTLVIDANDCRNVSDLMWGAERFEFWHEAIDAAVERQRPIVARVGNDYAKCFPSRACRTIYRGVFSSKGGQ